MTHVARHEYGVVRKRLRRVERVVLGVLYTFRRRVVAVKLVDQGGHRRVFGRCVFLCAELVKDEVVFRTSPPLWRDRTGARLVKLVIRSLFQVCLRGFRRVGKV